jgi:DNA mismatch endonuclease (patch repair protein)
LPGTPDIVLPARHTVVFVNGCFWHGHGCSIGKLPKSRLDFWEPKIEANKARDASRQEELINLGWSVIVVWQCELLDMPTLT